MNIRIACLSSVFLVLSIAHAAAQGGPPFNSADCNTPGCKVTEVNISTGFDHNHGTTFVPVSADAWWTLVGAPNTSLIVPSPAFVIFPNGFWATLAGSKWISAYDTDTLNENNASPKKPYSFQRCVCVCVPTVLHVSFDMLVDNIANVYFDNVLIASQTDQSVGAFQVPFHVETTMAAATGEHCLRIDVRNLSNFAMGLDVKGFIETSPPGNPIMLSPECCESTGKLIVRKFADTDCDGVMDSPASPLAGWTFTLSPGGATAVTDAQGKAYFTVAPGHYQLTESPKDGWSSGTPSNGTLAVDVFTGTVQTIDFLNCPNLGSITVCKYLDSNCNGVKDGSDSPLVGWNFGISNTYTGLTLGSFGSSGVSWGTTSGVQYTAAIRSKYKLVTGGSGCSTISLPLGKYTVSEVIPAGWTASNPATGSADVQLTAGAPHADLTFLNCLVPMGVISVCKYADGNCDGVQDFPPYPLAGWTFTVTPGNVSKVTDAQGCAEFFLPPGTYTVTETPKAGWTASNPASGQVVVNLQAFTSFPVTFLNCGPPAPWVDLGCATTGPSGTPALTAVGTLIPGSTLTLDVAHAPPGKSVLVLFGFGTVKSIPFFCGMLKVKPDFLVFSPPAKPADSSGNAHFTVTWPTGLPSGTPVYVQAVIIDSSLPCGGLLSNALCTTTP